MIIERQRFPKMLIKNEHGYVNNRGSSKYWGVSTWTNPSGGKDRWIVSFQILGTTHQKATRSFFFQWEASEEDAARVAAYVFDKGQKLSEMKSSDKIISADGKWYMHISPYENKISRVRVDEYVDIVKPEPVVKEEPQISPQLTTEDDVSKSVVDKLFTFKFKLLLEHVAQCELTPDQSAVLIGYLKAKSQQ